MSDVETVAASTTAFEDVDEDTLSVLVSGADFDDDKQLTGLLERFRDDVDMSYLDDFWTSLVSSVKALGFAVDSEGGIAPSKQDDSTKLPVAFETASGKRHLRATSSLLRISESRAARLTMSSLRAYTTEESHLSSLLGTRHLLEIVLKHHYPQRIARLQIVAECLRAEMDETSPHCESARVFLDELDSGFTVATRRRGLLQRLLHEACSEYQPPTRGELLPILDLRDDTTTAKREVVSDVFVVECMQASQVQRLREREEAMEALVVFLYSRIDQGIHRVDYILILSAFNSCHSFFSSLANVERLSHLTGMICAECMSLWYAAAESDVGPSWLARHPMLDGIDFGGPRTARPSLAVNLKLSPEHELLAIKSLLVEYSTQAMKRVDTTHSPSSISLLSMGLLLRLISQSVAPESTTEDSSLFKKWETHATECLRIANDECGAFAHLQSTLDTLIESPISFSSAILTSESPPYDWQFSPHADKLMEKAYASPSPGLSAASVAYASIGLELVASTISAFRTTVEKNGNISSRNLATLCDLAASVFQNHPTLCEDFWRDFQAFSEGSTTPSTPNHSVGFLFDTAHACASSAIDMAYASGDLRKEELVLSAITPMLTLASSLCSNTEMVESVINLLPEGTFRCTLLCCVPTGQVSDPSRFSETVKASIGSITSLAAVGMSTTCQALLRRVLESDGTADTPRILYRILARHRSDNDIVEVTLFLYASFLRDCSANGVWAMNAMTCLLSPSGTGAMLPRLLTGINDNVMYASAVVLNGVVNCIPGVVFNRAVSEDKIADALSDIMKANLACCTALSSALSMPATEQASKIPLSFRIARVALSTLDSFLGCLRPICSLHACPRIRSAAREFRHAAINCLATSTPVGQAVSYFASAPVALSVAIAMELMVERSKVSSLASEERRREDQKDIGEWRNLVNWPVVSGWSMGKDNDVLKGIEVDVCAIHRRGWADEESEPLGAAAAALRLLSSWATHVEDMIIERSGSDGASLSVRGASELRTLSPLALITSLPAVPPAVKLDGKLFSAWSATNGCSTADLLLRYMGSSVDNSTFELVESDAQSLVSICLAHGKLIGDSCLISSVERAGTYLAHVYLKSVDAVYKEIKGIGQGQRLGDTCASRSTSALRALSFLRKLIGSDARAAPRLFGNSHGVDLIKRLAVTIQSVRPLFERPRSISSTEQVQYDEKSVVQLRLADGALGLLVTALKTGAVFGSVTPTDSDKTTSTIKNCMDDTSLVTDVVDIIKSYSKSDICPSRDDPSKEDWASLMSSIVAKALQLIECELNLMLSNEGDGDQVRLQTLFEICRMPTENFTTIDSVLVVASSTERLVSEKIFPFSLFWSFPNLASSRWIQLDCSHTGGFNLPAISTWMSWRLGMDETRASVETARISAAYSLFSSQLYLCSAWGAFTQLALSTSFTGIDTINMLSRNILESLRDNAEVLEECQMTFSAHCFSNATARMSQSMFATFLQVVSAPELQASPAETVLAQFLAVCDRLFMMPLPEQNGSFAIILNPPFGEPAGQYNELLLLNSDAQNNANASAVHLLRKSSTFLSSEPSIAFPTLLGFVHRAGKTLKVVELLRSRSSSLPECEHAAHDLLQSSVSLLTAVSTTILSTGDPLFFSRIAPSLQVQNTVEALLREAGIASLKGVSGPPMGDTEQTVEILQSILALLCMLAEIASESPEVRTYLSTHGTLFQLIVSNPLLSAACESWSSTSEDPGAFSLRGYRPSKGGDGAIRNGSSRTVAGPSLSGRDDPVHKAWRTMIRLVRLLLRTRPLLRDEPVDKVDIFFFRLACDFLTFHRDTVLSCLQECCSFPIGSTEIATVAGHGRKALTYNVLREANEILALFSRLCLPMNMTGFAGASQELFRISVRASGVILSRLSKFLGSAGTARELFAALSEFEQSVQTTASADDWDEWNSLDRISPLLSRGIPYARHEAIRSAHCASRCCAFVTTEDYDSVVKGQTPDETPAQPSTASLERECQSFIESPFLIRMEYEAATCLSNAVLILWETHPAASCFAMFSEHDLGRFDRYSQIQPDTIVALRPTGRTTESVPSDTTPVFARVLQVDTMRHNFYVRYLTRDPTEETVHAGRLCGIEDMMKRSPAFDYEPAPESAIELEAAVTKGHTPTLGDVVLALRWCCQYQGQPTQPSAASWKRRLLAERLAILLGAEVSLHNEIESTESDSISTRVNAQLLGLFDESGPTRNHTSLISVLSPSVWRAIKDQLGDELRRARKERSDYETIEAKKESTSNASSPWQHIHPSTTRKSPFRGLGMSLRYT